MRCAGTYSSLVQRDLFQAGHRLLPDLDLPSPGSPDGTINTSVLDPLGPISKWQGGGTCLTDPTAIQQMQTSYPNPPRVVFLSNTDTI